MQETHQTNSLLGDFKKDNTKELPPFVINEEKVTEKQDKLIQLLDKAKELEEQGKYIEALKMYKEYEDEISLYPSIERAREILGKENVHDNVAIAKAFGLEQAQIPEPEPIPFSQEELEKAKEQGYMLVYRISETIDGVLLTPAKMNELVKRMPRIENLVYNIENVNIWFNKRNEDCIHKDTPHSGWALVTKELIPNSKGKNYLEQTQVIIDQLLEQYVDQSEIPPIILEGIREYNKKTEYLTHRLKKMKNDELSSEHQKKLNLELSNLIINKYFRRNVPDVIFDLQVHKSDTEENESLLKNSEHDWTNSVLSRGIIPSLGRIYTFDAKLEGALSYEGDSHRGVVISHNNRTL